MIVNVTTDGAGLVEADDLRQFHVAVPAGLTAAAIDSSLRESGAGQLENAGEAAIDIAWLRAAATEVPADWESRFQGMLVFATSKGWLTPGGGAVRGHLVRT